MKLIIDKDIPFIRERFEDNVEVIFLPGKEITPDKVKDADGLIVRTRTLCNERLLRDSKIKLVATATIGTDHIDKKWCENNGILVKNAPGCNAPGVAQYVLSSLLKTGFQEKDTLGIIGCGNVGSIVAEWAKQLGFKVLISDAPRKDAGFMDEQYMPLEEVLRNSDALTLHVPFTKEGKYPTFHLIGEKEIAVMKKGAILFNTSRGGVVDESVLKKFILKGRVKGVLDVWENEPMIDKELVDMVEIATPHIAGYSEEGKKRATRMALEAVKEVLGIPVDFTGLDCVPPSGMSISRDLIEKSYNPIFDSDALRSDPTAFEEVRNNYSYRHEPLFI